jgi:hypothetical protein
METNNYSTVVTTSDYSFTTEHSSQLGELALDLSKLQGELTHVSKDSKGYGYNYSSLPDTLDVAKPLLVKFGFSLSQFEDGSGNLVTMLLHKSGQWIKGRMKLIEIEMKGTNAAQNKGSVLSYFRRYSIQAILGMAAEDTDGTAKNASNKDSGSSIRSSTPVSTATPKSEEKPAVQNTGTNSNVTGRKSFRKSEDNL